MYSKLKKAISLLLAVLMVFSMPINISAEELDAVTAADAGTVEFGATNINLTQSNNEQQTNILFYMNKNAQIAGMTVEVYLNDDDDNIIENTIELGEFESSVTGFVGESNLTATFMAAKGAYAPYNQELDKYLVFSVPVTIAANATGKFDIRFEVTAFGDASGKAYTIKTPVTATITVEEPSEPVADYEIWYTLDPKVDSEEDENGNAAPDGYKEIELTENDDIVTATFFLKNNKEDTNLQAYDIYLTHSEHLIATPTTDADAEVKVFTDATATDGIRNTHVQFVAEAQKGFNKYTTDDDIVELGEVEFTVADTAVYGEVMDIRILPGSETAGEDTTNIAIGATLGDKESYYPGVINKITETVEGNEVDVEYKGVEITNTYDVTYYANAGEDTVTDLPDAQIKEHNVPLALTLTKLEREGYTFKGWTTTPNPGLDAEVEYEADVPATYETNADLALYAVWKKNAYLIKFVDEDGTTLLYSAEFEINTMPVYGGETPTKDSTDQYSYTFAGWYPELAKVTGEATYTATYTSKENSYTVTFKDVDGNNFGDVQTIVYGNSPTAPTTNPSMTDSDEFDYEFKGWTTDENAGYNAEVIVVGEYEVKGTTVFYPVFTQTKQTYQVEFSTTHGTAPQTETVEYGSAVTEPTGMAAEHYTFDGWYTDSEFKNKYDFNTAVTGPLMLYAKWTPVEYTITFQLTQGETMDNGAGATLPYTVEDKFTLPTASKDGMNFGGWQISEGANTSWTAGTTYNGEINAGKFGNVTMTAVWSNKPYSIDVDATNGDATINNTTGGGNTANTGETIHVTLVPGTGYEFTQSTTVTYEYIDKNGVSATGNATAVKGSNGVYEFNMPEVQKDLTEGSEVTVKVTFTAVKYGITYELKGGTADGNPTEYTIESDDITLIEPTKTGYTFTGWTGSNGTTPQTSVTIAKGSTGAKSYTANWTPTEYKITYLDKDGNVVAQEGKYTIESGATLVTPAEKQGYTFVGWYDNDQFTGEVITTIEQGQTEDKTFYGKWDPNTNTKYTVNHWQQNYGADPADYDTGYKLHETIEHEGTTDTEVDAPTKTYPGFTTPEVKKVKILADGTAVVDYYYVRAKYTVTFDPDTSIDDDETEIEYTYGDEETFKPAEKDGYTFDGWFDASGNEIEGVTGEDKEDIELTAKWTAIEYTIKLDADAGVVTAEGWTQVEGTSDEYTGTYTIEKDIVLPTPEKEYYVFDGWKVTKVEEEGNWDETAEISKDNLTVAKGRFGHVTLTAQWKRAATPVVEEYKYAYTGYRMLRVSANALVDEDTGAVVGEYQFAGESMYFTDDSNYKLNDTDAGVFYTLVSAEYIEGDTLTKDGYDLLTIKSDATQKTLYQEGEVLGDINGDGFVNVADANIVYQMIEQGTMGGYYTEAQLGVAARLKADMYTATSNNDHRGSIEDVNAIIEIINK